MSQKRVIVIGAGASGMTAAVFAARQGADVTLIEHGKRAGKKILSTGNGRCNFSNRYMDASCYRSEVPDFPMKVISRFPLEMTLDFFRDMGAVFRERDGYLYPYSGQASAVLDILCSEIEREKVKLITECETEHIADRNGSLCEYRVETSRGVFLGDSLIIATGGKAAPATGSDGSGYRLAKQMGHHIIKPLPALVQLRCRERFFSRLAGIRTEASVTLYSCGQILARDQGEVQLTDYGISGIPVFQVSRFAARELDRGNAVEAILDFYPVAGFDETEKMLHSRKMLCSNRTAENFLTGWLHKKLTSVLLREANIRPDVPVKELRDTDIHRLTALIKEFSTEVTAVNSFDQAQTCSGGVDVREIDPETMQSRKKRGLYFAGEIMDVDGICGGYNLQWAWSTGAIAGTHAAL